jgi:hypothetical protein
MLSEDLESVLAVVAARADCRVLPAAGLPSVGTPLILPADLADFYRWCGGLMLFQGSLFPWRVSNAEQLVLAGPRLLGGVHQAAQIAAENPDDLTITCFVIADDGTGRTTAPHVLIDLHPARAGRCYAAGWDTFGLVGDMPIIALHMAGLIRWLLEAAGDAPTGGDRSFGDAYQATL